MSSAGRNVQTKTRSSLDDRRELAEDGGVEVRSHWVVGVRLGRLQPDEVRPHRVAHLLLGLLRAAWHNRTHVSGDKHSKEPWTCRMCSTSMSASEEALRNTLRNGGSTCPHELVLRTRAHREH